MNPCDLMLSILEVCEKQLELVEGTPFGVPNCARRNRLTPPRHYFCDLGMTADRLDIRESVHASIVAQSVDRAQRT